MLAIEQVSARFGAVTALDGVSIAVARGEILCLLGPSGSGKSTLLRLVAGIERPQSGCIVIDGVTVAGPDAFAEPEARRVGLVFQDYALFPHLTVSANVAFGARGRPAAVAALLARLGLERLAGSYPHMLSGGERQRVALARALVPEPRVLLMDEPFSSLDSRLRDDVRRHTLELLREQGTTTIIVTHDPDEALRIADRIALLEAGRLVQIGTPEAVYGAPQTLFAARFFGDVAALPGVCRDGRCETALGGFAAPGLASGTQAVACIRSEHLAIAATPTAIAGRVVGVEFCGDTDRLLLAVDGLDNPVSLSVPREPGAARESGRLMAGATVHIEIRDHEVPVVAAV